MKFVVPFRMPRTLRIWFAEKHWPMFVMIGMPPATDASNADKAAGLRYFFSTSQAARDGAAYGTSGSASSQPFTFDDNGTYRVYARVMDKDGAGPALNGSLAGVPESLRGVLDLEEYFDVVAPRDFSHSLWEI